MFKLVALDIDGTLTGPKGQISKRNRAAVRAVQEKGVPVALCTGRNIRRTLPVAEQLGLTAPFACMDGVVLYHPGDKKAICSNPLKPEEVRAVLDAAKKHPVFVEYGDGDKYHKFAVTKELFRYDIFTQNTLRGKLKNHLEGMRYYRSLEPFYGFSQCYQLVVCGAQDTLEAIKKDLAGCENIDIRDHLWPNYLFINRKGMRKAHGITMLCDHFGFGKEEVLAIGDETNDIDMLQEVGLGVAMGNAVDRVKAVAKEIAAPNTEDGVAQTLEKHFLS